MWKYNQPTEELVEQPTMEEPKDHPSNYKEGEQLFQYWFGKWDEYIDHTKNLRRLAISGPHSWKHEQDVPEKEFETEIFCKETGKRCESIICNTECAYHIAIAKVETVEEAITRIQVNGTKEQVSVDYILKQYKSGNCPLSAVQASITSAMKEFGNWKQQQSGDQDQRKFTLQELINTWDGGEAYGWQEAGSVYKKLPIEAHNKKEFFEKRFNITITSKQ